MAAKERLIPYLIIIRAIDANRSKPLSCIKLGYDILNSTSGKFIRVRDRPYTALRLYGYRLICGGALSMAIYHGARDISKDPILGYAIANVTPDLINVLLSTSASRVLPS